MLGLIAGVVAGLSVIGFLEATDLNLQPLGPRLGGVFTVAVDEFGRPYILLDPAALAEGDKGEENKRSGGPRNGESSLPFLLFAVQDTLPISGSAPPGTPPQPNPGPPGPPKPGPLPSPESS